MQLAELQEALIGAELLMSEEHRSGVYQERDRKRLNHLVALAQWAQNKNKKISLDSQLNIKALYKTVSKEMKLDVHRFDSLQAIMEAIDDHDELNAAPLDSNNETLEQYGSALRQMLKDVQDSEPWRAGGDPDLFKEEFLIMPEPPTPMD